MPGTYARFATSEGNFTIRLFDQDAPRTVENFVGLAEGTKQWSDPRTNQKVQKPYYDGTIFHRVIDGFMAQTGDPTGTGMGGSKLPDIPAEFSSEPFKRGTLGMARSQDPNSANSQFFIMFADGDFLNGQYTVFGQVTEGMECVDAIARGEPPANPDKIVSMKLMKDAQ